MPDDYHWIRLDPDCPACQRVAWWREHHPKIEVDRSRHLRVNAYRLSEHPHAALRQTRSAVVTSAQQGFRRE